MEGDNIDYIGLLAAIEKSGAAVHGVEEIVVGDRMVDYRRRATKVAMRE